MIGPMIHRSRNARFTSLKTPRAGRRYIVSLYEHQEFF
jgi:hypothetical protein